MSVIKAHVANVHTPYPPANAVGRLATLLVMTRNMNIIYNSLFHYSGRKIKIEKPFPTKQITPSSKEKREEYWYN